MSGTTMCSACNNRWPCPVHTRVPAPRAPQECPGIDVTGAHYSSLKAVKHCHGCTQGRGRLTEADQHFMRSFLGSLSTPDDRESVCISLPTKQKLRRVFEDLRADYGSPVIKLHENRAAPDPGKLTPAQQATLKEIRGYTEGHDYGGHAQDTESLLAIIDALTTETT
jgi:hypothetical protein